MTQLKHFEGPHFPLLHLFVLQALSGLDVAHPCQGGQSALLSLTQMLVSSGNNLTDTPRNHIHPNIWAPHDPVKLTHGINHHSHHFHPSPPLCLCTRLPGDTETQKINLVIKKKKKKRGIWGALWKEKCFKISEANFSNTIDSVGEMFRCTPLVNIICLFNCQPCWKTEYVKRGKQC